VSRGSVRRQEAHEEGCSVAAPGRLIARRMASAAGYALRDDLCKRPRAAAICPVSACLKNGFFNGCSPERGHRCARDRGPVLARARVS